MDIYTTFMEFTDHLGVKEYVSIYEYSTSPPDCYQGDLSDTLYKKVGEGFGHYVPV